MQRTIQGWPRVGRGPYMGEGSYATPGEAKREEVVTGGGAGVDNLLLIGGDNLLLIGGDVILLV